MKGQMISHPDFADLEPISLFHKESVAASLPEHPENLKNRHILFRRSAVLPAFRNAILRITADDRYKLWINGVFVTEGPALGYPTEGYYYREADVTDLLSEGANCFAVHTYYQGLINRAHYSGDLREGLRFELLLDGETFLVSDELWKCADHTGFSSDKIYGYDTAFSENYDARSPEDRFYLPEYDDSSWGVAKIKRVDDYRLIRQTTPPPVAERIEPAKAERNGNRLFLDFGREAVGALTLSAKGKRGDVITLRFGEELDGDGRVRYDMRCYCKYEETLTLSGEWDELPSMEYKGFRYVEIVLPEGAEVRNTVFLAKHFPFEDRAEYPEGPEALSRILTLCKDTVRYATQENYIDCPTREKGQYLGDLAVSGRAQAILTRDTSLLRKSLLDFCRSAKICQGLMAVAPGALMQEIADYSLLFPALCTWVYAFDGDIDFLKEVEPTVTAELGYFRKYMREDGLIEDVFDKWNLVDWPDNLRDGYSFPLTRPVGPGHHNVLNAFWYGFLRACDELYGILGMPKTGLCEKVRVSFRSAFLSEESGLFCDAPDKKHTAVHSVILPLLFGLCEGKKERDRCADFIGKKKLPSMGVYMAYFALASLKQNGYDDEALALTVDSDAWLNMLSEGATTTFEAWGKEQKFNTSLCHPWAVAPLIVFAKGVRIY